MQALVTLLAYIAAIAFFLWSLKRFVGTFDGSKRPTPAKKRPVDTTGGRRPSAKAEKKTVADDIVSMVEPPNDNAATEKSFRAVFAIMTSERRGSIARYYAQASLRPPRGHAARHRRSPERRGAISVGTGA
jgi:hypothetical protein